MNRAAAAAVLAAVASSADAVSLCPADAVASLVADLRARGVCGDNAAAGATPCLSTLSFDNGWGVFHAVLDVPRGAPRLADLGQVGPTTRRQRVVDAALDAARWYGLADTGAAAGLLQAANLPADACDGAATRERVRALTVLDARVPVGHELWEVTVYPDGTTRGPRVLPRH